MWINTDNWYCLRQVQLRSTRSAHANYANYVEIMDSDDDDDGEELQSAIAASFQPHNSATAIHKFALSTALCQLLYFRFVILCRPEMC